MSYGGIVVFGEAQSNSFHLNTIKFANFFADILGAEANTIEHGIKISLYCQ